MNKKIMLLAVIGILAIGGVTYAGTTTYIANKKVAATKENDMKNKLDSEKQRLESEKQKLEEEKKDVTINKEDKEKQKLEEENKKLQQAKEEAKSKTVDFSKTTAFDKKIAHNSTANIKVNIDNSNQAYTNLSNNLTDCVNTLEQFKEIMKHFLNNQQDDLSVAAGTQELERFFKNSYSSVNKLKGLADKGVPEDLQSDYKDFLGLYQQILDNIDYGLIFDDSVKPRQVVDKKPDIMNKVYDEINNIESFATNINEYCKQN